MVSGRTFLNIHPGLRFSIKARGLVPSSALPTNLADEVDDKINLYLEAGVRLVWEINPKIPHVIVYRADGTVSRLLSADVLSGENVIAGFTCGMPVNLLK